MTGDPKPILDLMRESKKLIQAHHPEDKFIEAMGIVARCIHAEFTAPAKRLRMALELKQCLEVIDKGGKSLTETQTIQLREATDLYVRVWLGQYSYLTSTLHNGGFDTLSHNVDWEGLNQLRLDGSGINNPLVPDKVRSIREINRALVEMSRSFLAEKESSQGLNK